MEQFVPEQLSANGFELLRIDFAHVAGVERLVFHHRDPFDGFLVAQALIEDMAIVSADPVFRRYRVKRVW